MIYLAKPINWCVPLQCHHIMISISIEPICIITGMKVNLSNLNNAQACNALSWINQRKILSSVYEITFWQFETIKLLRIPQKQAAQWQMRFTEQNEINCWFRNNTELKPWNHNQRKFYCRNSVKTVWESAYKYSRDNTLQCESLKSLQV